MIPTLMLTMEKIFVFLQSLSHIGDTPAKVGAVLLGTVEANPNASVELNGVYYTPKFVKTAAYIALGCPVQYRYNDKKEVCGMVFETKKLLS